jgi:hypothetical protein
MVMGASAQAEVVAARTRAAVVISFIGTPEGVGVVDGFSGHFSGDGAEPISISNEV